MRKKETVAWLTTKYRSIVSTLNERSRRRWAAVEASSLGHGAISAVALATGLSRTTIHWGINELNRSSGQEIETDRIRKHGGGRKLSTVRDPELVSAIDRLIEPSTRGDPRTPLRWTSKSLRHLAEELLRQRHKTSFRTIGTILQKAGYSLQANRKTREGKSHPDRDEQFRYISQQVLRFQREGQPVISVDTKKKELVGNYRNNGREWRRQGKALKVKIYDFIDPKKGKAIPYGVYDITNNEGWVSVGMDHDTAEFAAEAINRWWRKMGRKRFPKAKKLMIAADSGGSNGHRNRLWKVSLQKLANRIGLDLMVSHFPPGTSKWNKIEHRMFCHITQNWRGKPLVSYRVIVDLISGTRTNRGLRIKAELDSGRYEDGIRVNDDELERVRLKRSKFHGDWNYAVLKK